MPSDNEKKKIVITNPTQEQLKFLMGYKDLVIDEQPETTERQYAAPVYEETDTTITKHWEIKDIEQDGLAPDSVENSNVYFEDQEQSKDVTAESE